METLFKYTSLPKITHEPTYTPSQIRTADMPSFRGSDLEFDPEHDPSYTQQQFAAECDINNIIAQYEVTGMLHHSNPHQPLQGDFSEFGPSTDFIAAQNYLVEAQAAFDALPAKVRDRFANDPAKLLDFVNDPSNDYEARKLGLLNPVPETPPETPPTPSGDKKSDDGASS